MQSMRSWIGTIKTILYMFNPVWINISQPQRNCLINIMASVVIVALGVLEFWSAGVCCCSSYLKLLLELSWARAGYQ